MGSFVEGPLVTCAGASASALGACNGLSVGGCAAVRVFTPAFVVNVSVSRVLGLAVARATCASALRGCSISLLLSLLVELVVVLSSFVNITGVVPKVGRVPVQMSIP